MSKLAITEISSAGGEKKSYKGAKASPALLRVFHIALSLEYVQCHEENRVLCTFKTLLHRDIVKYL